MVHPYLRRREGQETVDYPTPELRDACSARRSACRCSRSRRCGSRSNAPASRRPRPTSCAAPWRPSSSPAGVSTFRDKLITGMVGAATTRDFAERTFRQLEGFGSYGFPESHAASFALDRLCVVLDEVPPPGRLLLRPPQRPADGLLRAGADRARRAATHGVEVRPVDVNALPLGLHARSRRATGALRRAPRPAHGEGPGECRRRPHRSSRSGEEPFASIEDLWRRAGDPGRGARAPGRGRRLRLARRSTAATRSGRSRVCATRPLPLFAAADEREGTTASGDRRAAGGADPDDRGPRGGGGLPLEGPDPARASRSPSCAPDLDERRHPAPAAICQRIRDGGRVTVAGLVLVRQKPGSAKGVMFITHRGRDRRRQPRHLVGPVREATPAAVVLPACSAAAAACSARAA